MTLRTHASERKIDGVRRFDVLAKCEGHTAKVPTSLGSLRKWSKSHGNGLVEKIQIEFERTNQYTSPSRRLPQSH